ncbi:MAG: helix-turn-helix domain-containing protein [Ilumatobacteraceae bacterium]
MSLRAMSWAWAQATKSSGERLVLLALADHAGEDGECWPQTGRLGEKCDLDRKTVQRHLTALDERGIIEKVSRRKRPNGTLAGWTYRLPLETSEGTPTTRLRGNADDLTEREHGRPVLEGASMPSQEPSLLNPQIEPSINNRWSEFWEAYPRKTGKQACEKAWGKLKEVDQANAIAALGDHVALWVANQTATQFIPHPATWLNGRRWEDELPLPHSQQKKSAPGMGAVRKLLEESHRNG